MIYKFKENRVWRAYKGGKRIDSFYGKEKCVDSRMPEEWIASAVEAFNPDNDFVRAMEHGFPPISGVGVGVDRLASIIFDQPTLRDVILFPIMK